MDCREFQDWLLTADDVRPAAWPPGPAAEHVAGCADCRRFAARLADLEQAWRALPVDPQCARAKQAFLARLAPAPAAKPVTRRTLLRRVAWASAASLLAGTGGWLFLENQQANASDELLGSLLDWNLRLTQADSVAERNRLFTEAAPRLESAVSRSSLSEEHSQLAGLMLENGRWMAAHCDPVGEAARFDNLANRLLHLAQTAEQKGRYRRMNRLLQQYNRATESGINLNLERAEAKAASNAEQQQALKRLYTGWDGRTEQLNHIERTAPEPARQEIQRARRFHLKRPGRVSR
jgi:hypothetical protein